MGKSLIFIAILSAALLLACDSPSSPQSTGAATVEFSKDSLNGVGFADSAGVRGPASAPVPAGASSPPGVFQGLDVLSEELNLAEPAGPAAAIRPAGDGDASFTLQTNQRRIISNASVSIEVETVEAAIDQVRSIAEGLGGLVEHLSSFGSDGNQQANMTLRVPQDQFFTAVDRIEELGKVRARNLGSEDVSEQFIDLEARLKSSLREEESLLSLLERANQISETLSIERELSRVRADIERVQGQLNFLERRVDLATISVSLFRPSSRLPEPPSAIMVIEESNVSDRVSEVKNLTATLNGEIDQVLLSTKDGRERADISLRVFPKDFEQVMNVLESQGKIVSRNVREGFTSARTEDVPPENPNSRIEVSFTEPVSSSYLWLQILIALALVGIILAVAFYLTFRAGRNRTDRFIQSNQ
jgi:hypothetical protein